MFLAVAAAVFPGCALIANLSQFDDDVHGGPGRDAQVTDAIGEAGPDAMDASPEAEASSPPTSACNGTGWPDGGMNLLVDPDFSNDAGDGGPAWGSLYGGMYSTPSTITYCGMNVAELAGRSAFYNALATNITTTPGTYIVSAWVMQDAPVAVGLALGGLCVASSGSNYPGGPMQVVQPNTWTFLSGSMTVPAGCNTMQFFVTQQMTMTGPYPDIFAAVPYLGQ